VTGSGTSGALRDRAACRKLRVAMLKRIVGLFRPYCGQVVLATLAIVAGSSLAVVNPFLIQRVFDRALFCGPACPDLTQLAWLVGLMILVPAAGAAIGVTQTYLTSRVGQRMMRDLRDRLYSHLQSLSLRFFTTTRTGEIQSRLTNDVGGVQTVVTTTVGTLVANVVLLACTLAAMLVLSWQLTIIAVVLLPLFLAITRRVGGARRGIATRVQQAKAEVSVVTQETLSVSGILLSSVFDRRREEIERFRHENGRLAELSVREMMVGQSFLILIQGFYSIMPALIYLAAGIALHQRWGLFTAGTLVAFTTLQLRLYFPVGQVLQHVVEIQASLALFERIFEYLDLRPEITDGAAARTVPVDQVEGHVELDDIHFSYDAAAGGEPRTWALRGVSMDVRPGQLVAIVGPSGAGKTTCSYLLMRLYEATRGAVRIDGIDVRDLKLATLRGIVGMVTQESYLFHATIRENLLYARPEATVEEMEEAARTAKIHDRIAELPDRYETVVGERGYRLSGGEKQRVAIARVALKSPRILVLDEATGALDTTNERLVQAALRSLMRGRTTIAIAHRLSTILAADVIFVMDRGRVVERGSHRELVEAGGLYADLYRQQFSAQAAERPGSAVGIVSMRPDEVANEIEAFTAVYRSAFAAPPYSETETHARRFAEQALPPHLRRPGFRCVAARDAAGGELIGFAYGYACGPGQWWHDHILASLGADVVAEWGCGSFEIAEVAVAAAFQGLGIGARLHDALLEGLPHGRAVLMARKNAPAALRLYLGHGWTMLGDVPGHPTNVVMGLRVHG
jgi:ATP-binding cassette subfamily B protein